VCREFAEQRGTLIAIVTGMLALSRKTLALLLPVVCLGGCGSDDEFTADVAGNYTLAITNGDSTCSFEWEEGKEATGIALEITQEGKSIHGTIGGATGGLFTLLFGSAEFDGHISGNSLSLTNYGTRSMQEGNCSYTYNSTVQGRQTSDSIDGTITYSTKTNGNPDCSAVECSATQKFSGSRPPK
jgi:hypothetical protein